MINIISLREWQENYINGAYDAKDVKTQIEAGWYDWFCSDAALSSRLRKMARVINRIQDSEKINLDTMYVWFKNNCPCEAPLYDDFRIADLETHNVLFTVMVDCKRENYKYVVYGRENNFDSPLFQCGDARALLKWFND